MDDNKSQSKKRSTPESRSPVKPAKKSKAGSASTTTKKATKKTKEGTSKTASKKEYTEKEGYGVVLQYINEQNKPFNAQTIFDNLHKTVKKTFVVRILAQLAQEGKIIEKEFGKFKVYFADQSQFPSVSEAELKTMDEEIESLEESVKSLQGEVGMLRNQLKELDSSLTDEELSKAIESMKAETEQMTAHVNSLQGAEMIDPKELESLRNEVVRVQKIWRQRRSQCREMVGNIADSMEKKDQEVCEMIGLETEEELGIALPFKK
ncbi:hypothetical protein WA538_000745 [Blastocystis sp. DL]